MREIKFRQPIFVVGKFASWHYWGFTDDGFIGAIFEPSKTKAGDSYQYTGRKDRTGKEIYAGDRVRDDKGQVSTVEWDDVMTGWFPFHRSTQPFIRSYEIIDSIYKKEEVK